MNYPSHRIIHFWAQSLAMLAAESDIEAEASSLRARRLKQPAAACAVFLSSPHSHEAPKSLCRRASVQTRHAVQDLSTSNDLSGVLCKYSACLDQADPAHRSSIHPSRIH